MLTRIPLVAAAVALVVLVTAAHATAANPNRGKTLFRGTCKTCHVKGGAAPDLSPLTKTQAQWTRAFKKEVPVMVERVQARTGKTLTDADLGDMRLFLVSHAADSDQPETCGLK